MSENNGHMAAEEIEKLKTAFDGAGPEQPAMMSNVQTIDRMIKTLNQPTSLIVGTMVRGFLSGAPGVPVPVLLNVLAWHFGHMLGSSVAGDIIPVTQIRKGIREAFLDGLQKAPLNPSTVPMQPTDPAFGRKP